jgi:hypothetical protein
VVVAVLHSARQQKWSYSCRSCLPCFLRPHHVTTTSTPNRFAIPLLCGIIIGLAWANTDPLTYTYWWGKDKHVSHDDHNYTNYTSNYTTVGVVECKDVNLTYNVSTEHPTLFGISIWGHRVRPSVRVDDDKIRQMHSYPLSYSSLTHSYSLTHSLVNSQIIPIFMINEIFMCFFFGLAVAELVHAFQKGGTLCVSCCLSSSRLSVCLSVLLSSDLLSSDEHLGFHASGIAFVVAITVTVVTEYSSTIDAAKRRGHTNNSNNTHARVLRQQLHACLPR